MDSKRYRSEGIRCKIGGEIKVSGYQMKGKESEAANDFFALKFLEAKDDLERKVGCSAIPVRLSVLAELVCKISKFARRRMPSISHAEGEWVSS